MKIFTEFLNGKYSPILNTKRWNGFLTVKEESLGEHHYMVTIFTNVLCTEMHLNSETTLTCLQYAMHHDWDELFSGDILHGVKYNEHNGDEFRMLVNSFVEKEIDKEFGDESDISALINCLLDCNFGGSAWWNKFIKDLVKLADWMSMTVFSYRELNLGNKSFLDRFEYCKERTILHINLIRSHLHKLDRNGDKIFVKGFYVESSIGYLSELSGYIKELNHV